LLNIV